MKIAVFPGTFDPITRGHIDVIIRSLEIFDKLIVAVLHNNNKKILFTLNERMDMITESCKDLIPKYDDLITVKSFDGLLVNFLKQIDVRFVVRGLRVVSDFEYEFQMTMMNRELSKNCEIVFLMPNQKYSFVSSSLVKEIALFNGDISSFVTDNVMKLFKDKNIVK